MNTIKTTKRDTSKGFLQLIVVIIIFVIIVFVFKIDVRAIVDSAFVQEKIIPLFKQAYDFIYSAFIYLVNQFR